MHVAAHARCGLVKRLLSGACLPFDHGRGGGGAQLANAAGLEKNLTGPGYSFTILAPPDAAFTVFLQKSSGAPAPAPAPAGPSTLPPSFCRFTVTLLRSELLIQCERIAHWSTDMHDPTCAAAKPYIRSHPS